jgi:hypothetical protein
MKLPLDTPKIFISYCWKPEANKQKVLLLAERLTNDGIHVILDVWDLSEGQDKYHFMEQMVNNKDVIRVLIICNKEYAEKANSKSGGVGSESLIISRDVYNHADQKKFIPIIFAKDEDGKECVPTFIHSRIYVDLSNDEIFESEYEKLIRNIFDKPEARRPALGTPPVYLSVDDPVFLRTAHKVKTIENALVNERKNSQVFVDEYYVTFLEALKDFDIADSDLSVSSNVDDIVLSKIDALRTLRDDFIKFVEVIFTFYTQLDIEKFLSFLEKVIGFVLSHKANQHPADRVGYLQIDHYRFFVYEMFLYVVTVLIEKERFREIGEILSNNFTSYESRRNKITSFPFTVFNAFVSSLDKVRNQRLGLNRVSFKADLIKQRADHQKYSFEKLKEIESILYYSSIMMNENGNPTSWIKWWPYTAAYPTENIHFFDKLVSLKYCQKIMPLFGAKSFEEFKERIDRVIRFNNDRLINYDHNYYLPEFAEIFNVANLGTIK